MKYFLNGTLLALTAAVLLVDVFPETSVALDKRLRDWDARMATRLSSRISGAPRMDKEKTK